MLRLNRTMLTFVVFALLIVVIEARAAGVHEDTSGEAGFLFAPHQNAMSVRATIIERGDVEGSVYLFAATVVLRDGMLVQIEQGYISTNDGTDLRSGIGDMRLRGLVSLFHRDGRRLSLLGTVRTGTGNSTLFPYSSQSFDIEAGIGYVDTLDAVHLWGVAQLATVNRAPATGNDDTLHGDFLRAGGGVMIPISKTTGIRFGGTFLKYRHGAVRDLYMIQLHHDYTPRFRFLLAAGIEAGSVPQRVGDQSFDIGGTLSF